MNYHSKSLVAFGQLLNSLTSSLTTGAPIPVSLDIIKRHFSADIVLLGITKRGQDCIFLTDSAFCGQFDHDIATHQRTSQLHMLIEQYRHVTSTENAADGAVEYSLFVFRERCAPKFNEEENALTEIVTSHIAHAIDLASRLDSNAVETALYSSALDRLNIGVIIVNENGHIAKVSDVAGRALEERDGLLVQGQKLRATSATEDRALQSAISAAAQAGQKCTEALTRGISLTKSSGSRTLGVVVRPIPASGRSSDNHLVAVYLRDSDITQDVEIDFMRQILDLTHAEAAVTRRIASGLSLEDTAVSLGISRNTARAHLRSIFSKVGISRQTDLVRLVLNSAVLLGDHSSQAA